LSYHVVVETGEPVEKILQEAHSGGYDLVVITKRGRRSSVKDAVMGGTARRVIRRCKVPVMVVQLPDCPLPASLSTAVVVIATGNFHALSDTVTDQSPVRNRRIS